MISDFAFRSLIHFFSGDKLILLNILRKSPLLENMIAINDKHYHEKDSMDMKNLILKHTL